MIRSSIAPPARGALLLSTLALILGAAGCSDSATSSLDASGPDASASPDAVAEADATSPPDSGAQSDAAPVDLGVAPDAEPARDTGPALTPDLVFGQHVTVNEARVAIGDTFTAVVAKLGRGQRSAQANTRSYEWTLSGGTALTVWFVNSNVDDDDAAPNEVDGTDTVLWIAVSGSFAGKTMDNLGLGSPRAAVEASLGAPNQTTDLTNPVGVLASHYTRGALVAYSPQGTVRTITVCRAYVRAPDGVANLADAQLAFGGQTIRAGGLITSTGTREADIKRILGEPDASGTISVSGLELGFLNYSFLGMEMFLTRTGRTLLFTSVHTPWYGGTGAGNPGLGATKAAMETYLGGAGLGGAVPSGSQPQTLTCYPLRSRSGAGIGVTYSADNPPTVTALVLGIVMTNGMCP